MSFYRALLYSTVAHLVFLIFCTIIANTKQHYQPKSRILWITLAKGTSSLARPHIKPAKDLPQTTIQEQKDKTTKQTANQKKRMTIHKPEKKPRISKEEKMIRSALAKIDEELKKQTEAEAAQIPKEEGGVSEHGTEMSPMNVPVDDPEYSKYQATVRSQIMEQWILPSYLENDENRLSCTFIIMINRNGEIISSRLVKSSGNASFDASAMRAISKASPLPTPPNKLKWEVFNEGFEVEFDPTLKLQR